MAVVFWHWTHFFYRGTDPDPLEAGRQPLYRYFAPLYDQGFRAVDLFFCLSGFIFYWLYCERIANRSISFRSFLTLRLSRLYPLHLATLLLVAVLQLGLHWHWGTYFVYGTNDASHFGLQLLLATDWRFTLEHSFNGPSWSISVEMLLYGLFFVFCALRWTGSWWLMLPILCGCALIYRASIGLGLFSFFIGGLTFKAFVSLRRWQLSTLGLSILSGIALALATLWVVLLANFRIFEVYQASAWNGRWLVGGKDVTGIFLIFVSARALELCVFPLSVLVLALWDAHRPGFNRRLAVLGQISFSAYLWHFPLQLMIVAVFSEFTTDRSWFNTPAALGLFFGLLLTVSWLSYRWFEMPAQRWLRARLLPH